MRVGIVGFGLIGGSIARALRAHARGDWTVVAWSPSGVGPRLAAERGEVVAASRASDAIRDAELIVLAAPPLQCLALIDELAAGELGTAAPSAVVTDVASTKRRIVERGRAKGVRFVGGHPMAGLERTGYAAATGDLFVDRPWVVCPTSDEDAVARVEALARTVGARPIQFDAVTHDLAVAAVSHLPIIVSAALVESVLGTEGGSDEQRAVARALAASGWRDMTRLARGDAGMAADIAVTNADELAVRVRAFKNVIEDWLTELERGAGPDGDLIRDRLSEIRALLEADGAASQIT
jgi:prephenate dehydrogenase